jgi:hypothetical protein
MQCLDERGLRLYVRGSLPAERMAAGSEHVRTCAACRAALSALPDYRQATWSLGQTALALSECPEYEDLSAFVDGNLAHEPYQAMERHVSTCELCWHDVETLGAARSRASLAPPITVRPGQFVYRRPRTVFGWRSVAAAAAVAGAAAALFLIHPNPGRKPAGPPEVANNSPGISAPAPSHVTQPAPFHQPVVPTHEAPKPAPTPAPQPLKPEFVAELHDGSVSAGRLNGRLTVRADGRRLSEAELEALLERKLRDGRVPSSFQIAERPVVRGPADVINITKLSPAPNSVADQRPEFRWEPVDGASKYRVEVYELDGTAVLPPAETRTASYQPDEKLRGGVYKWMIWVRRGDLARWQASEAAVFRVLSGREASLLSQVRRHYAGSHLVLGTVYESLGLCDDAVREFQALAAQNPKSPLAAKLLAGARNH